MSDEIDKTVRLADDSTYANIFSYMGLPLSRDLDRPGLDAVVMGIPYDLGTRPWNFCLNERLRTIDYGDVQFASGDSEDMLAQVEAHAARITAAGKTLISLGGDHFVTLPLLRGHVATHGKLALIHFDAHTDTYAQHEKYDHGSMFYRAPREGLVDAEHSVQIGIRTEYDRPDHGD